jgi:GrpB-like predicted nucleotidyltransferase (UPF0157 family)
LNDLMEQADYTETGSRRMVEVVEYDPTWPERFARERSSLVRALPEALMIEHIGSTSVPGLSAKPTIDILVVVSSVEAFDAAERALAELGYERRDSFAEDEQHAFFRKVVDGRRTHHLHMLTRDSPRSREYLLFRDYLRSHPPVAEEYSQVKLDLAATYATNRDRYVVEKSKYVSELLKRALPSSDDAERH